MVYWLRCPVGGGALAGLFIAFCVLISYTVSTRPPSGIRKKGENAVSAYLITYDLNAQGQNYESVIKTIKECSVTWYSAWRSSYLIKSNMTSKQINDRISQYLDGNDTLLVIEVADNYNGRLIETDWDNVKQIFT